MGKRSNGHSPGNDNGGGGSSGAKAKAEKEDGVFVSPMAERFFKHYPNMRNSMRDPQSQNPCCYQCGFEADDDTARISYCDALCKFCRSKRIFCRNACLDAYEGKLRANFGAWALGSDGLGYGKYADAVSFVLDDDAAQTWGKKGGFLRVHLYEPKPNPKSKDHAKDFENFENGASSHHHPWRTLSKENCEQFFDGTYDGHHWKNEKWRDGRCVQSNAYRLVFRTPDGFQKTLGSHLQHWFGSKKNSDSGAQTTINVPCTSGMFVQLMQYPADTPLHKVVIYMPRDKVARKFSHIAAASFEDHGRMWEALRKARAFDGWRGMWAFDADNVKTPKSEFKFFEARRVGTLTPRGPLLGSILEVKFVIIATWTRMADGIDSKTRDGGARLTLDAVSEVSRFESDPVTFRPKEYRTQCELIGCRNIVGKGRHLCNRDPLLKMATSKCSDEAFLSAVLGVMDGLDDVMMDWSHDDM